MHQQQQNFFRAVKLCLPQYFTGTKVYDFGSRNVNGDNRGLFQDCDYTGIDIGPGPNVDIIGKACEVDLPGLADVIISGEMLEHDETWEQSLWAFVRWCRPDGLVLFSCAAPGRVEHGTRRCDPSSSEYTLDYYRNLDREDIERALPVRRLFRRFVFSGDATSHDLYFWGVRNALDLSNLSET